MKRFIFCILAITFLASCASYKTKIHKSQDQSFQAAGGEDFDQIVYLVGDAGKLHNGMPSPVLKSVTEMLNPDDAQQSIVFLGDNIYPHGMPKKEDPTRSDAEQSLNAQLDVIKKMKGKAVLLPGNHDWYSNGLEGVARQEKYVQKNIKQKNVFLPADGCPGPVLVELSDELNLIVFDSKWILEDFYGKLPLDTDCDISHYTEFPAEYARLLNKSQNKTVLVVFHHPLASYGSHGGHFSAKSHLFPLTEGLKNGYLPLPGLGSFGHMLRIDGGVSEDVTGEAISYLRNAMITASKNHGRVIFASGHDHNLQLIDIKDVPQIVSGAGTKQTPTRIGGDSEFTTGQLGFTRLVVSKSGDVDVEYYTVNDGARELAFAKKLYKAQEHYDISNLFPSFEDVSSRIYEGKDKGGLHRFILGKWYRSLYYEPISVPSLNLSTYAGEVLPVKKGGGLQTNSLRLRATDGREYALRALHKDASRLTGGVFDNSVVIALVEDFFTVAHPYAAIAMAPMADELGLYHTNPQLVYLPQQKNLGDYNPAYGDKLFLLEERPDGKLWNTTKSFGESPEIISTSDMNVEIISKYSHRVDQDYNLRARLFDHIIGDWDRHQDQWRWASIEDKDNTLYRPIPRDRDQAFSKFDGLLTAIVKRTIPTVRKFQSFSPETKRLKWFNFNNRHVDRWYLNDLDWADWESQISYIQENLSQKSIAYGVGRMPQVSIDYNGEEVESFLLQRRDNLSSMARKYYLRLAKDVDVLGTEKEDYFHIHGEKGVVRVRRYKYKKGEKSDLLYDRSFDPKETNRIYLWGLEGEDKFEITGDLKKSPKIYILGGKEPDQYIDENHKGRKWVRVYDKESSSELASNSNIKMKGLPDKSFYRPDWNERNYDYGMGIPLPASNSEDGFGLGYSYIYTDYGFHKSPYRSLHKINASYVFQTQAWNAEYSAVWKSVVGSLDFLYTLSYHGPSWNFNYFGLGNETDYDSEETELSFNRTRQERINGFIGLEKDFLTPWSIGFGIDYSRYRLNDNEERFVETPSANIPLRLKEWNSYLSAQTWLKFEKIDNATNPIRAVEFSLIPSYTNDLNNESDGFLDLRSHLTMHHPISLDNKFRYAGKLSFHMATEGYEFFQSPAIGRLEGVRGLRQGRFRGDRSLAFSNDFYLDLFKVRGIGIPFDLGLIGSYDVGRVWLDSEDSETWHGSPGGGLSFNILKMIKLSASYHVSKDDKMLLIGVGKRL